MRSCGVLSTGYKPWKGKLDRFLSTTDRPGSAGSGHRTYDIQWTVSSARSSTEGDNLNPSALAVLRLISSCHAAVQMWQKAAVGNRPPPKLTNDASTLAAAQRRHPVPVALAGGPTRVAGVDHLRDHEILRVDLRPELRPFALRPPHIGGLMSFGADGPTTVRHAAKFVQRILQGKQPKDMPIEQPTKFELALNLKTAKAIGLKIPESFLARADALIE